MWVAPHATSWGPAASAGTLEPEQPTTTLVATDQGWRRERNGYHDDNNPNYVVGSVDDGGGFDVYRNFAVFDTASLPSGHTVIAASLRAFVGSIGYAGDASEVYELHEVTSSEAAVTAGGNNPAVYQDLGDGPVFGSTTITAADQNSHILVPLNPAGVAALDAASGSFILGGVLATNDGDDRVFGGGGNPGDLLELIVTTQP